MAKIARYSSVYQLENDPLISKRNKAIFQEEGEIMCEGVIEAVLNKCGDLLTNTTFWREILYNRKEYIKALEKLLDKKIIINIITFLGAWKNINLGVDPNFFSSYFVQYMNSIKYWKKFNSQAMKL